MTLEPLLDWIFSRHVSFADLLENSLLGFDLAWHGDIEKGFFPAPPLSLSHSLKTGSWIPVNRDGCVRGTLQEFTHSQDSMHLFIF